MKRRYADDRQLNQLIAKAAMGAGGVGLVVLFVVFAL